MASVLPEIPSDNVYKFISFSGLFLIIFFSTYYIIAIQEEKLKRIEYEYKLNQAKIHHDLIMDTLNSYTQKEKDQDFKHGKVLQKSDSIGNLSFKYGFKDGQPQLISERAKSSEYREQQKFLEEFHPEYADDYLHKKNLKRQKDIRQNIAVLQQQKISDTELDYHGKLLVLKNKEILFLTLATIFFDTVGLILFVNGLIFWYKKVQIPTDKILLRDSNRV